VDERATRAARERLSRWLEMRRAGVSSGEQAPDMGFESELGAMLGIPGRAELAAWCSRRAVIELVIELGVGAPSPIAPGAWRRAAVVDPLADALVSQGLGEDACWRNATIIAAAGESLPFAGSSVDLVICREPSRRLGDAARVALEIRRVLRPEGVLWLIGHGGAAPGGPAEWCAQLRRFLALECGFVQVGERKSAEGRGCGGVLLRKPAASELLPGREERPSAQLEPRAVGSPAILGRQEV
jgi:SAM-dependent methyltransferase